MVTYCKNSMTHEDIRKLAAELGEKVRYGKYRMWHQVPFIRNTAIVVDEVERRGGHAIITDPKKFPSLISIKFIREAIENDAISLGRNQPRNFRYDFAPWYNLIGNYPAGFFTHRVGDNI